MKTEWRHDQLLVDLAAHLRCGTEPCLVWLAETTIKEAQNPNE